MVKRAAHRGRSERGDEAQSVRSIEPPSDVSTTRAGRFIIPLWLAERALALDRGASLLHRRKRPFLIGIFEPPSLPKVAGGMDRGDFGTAILVKSHSIDGTRDVNPVNHN